MKILSKSYVESLRIVGNKFHNLHTNPRFHHCYFYNFIEIKNNCLRSHSKITCKGMIARQHGHCFLNGKWFSHLPFYANINIINAKFQAHCTKSFGGLKEDRFSRFHNDNWNSLWIQAREIHFLILKCCQGMFLWHEIFKGHRNQVSLPF